jgi:hypothetical protein
MRFLLAVALSTCPLAPLAFTQVAPNADGAAVAVAKESRRRVASTALANGFVFTKGKVTLVKNF